MQYRPGMYGRAESGTGGRGWVRVGQGASLATARSPLRVLGVGPGPGTEPRQGRRSASSEAPRRHQGGGGCARAPRGPSLARRAWAARR